MKHSDIAFGDLPNKRVGASLAQRLEHADPVVPTVAGQKTHLERATRIEEAAKALLADVRRRYPGEELQCPLMQALDKALNDGREQALQRLHDKTQPLDLS